MSVKLSDITGSLSDYARKGPRERSRASARDRGCIPLEEIRRKYGLRPRAARLRRTR